MLEEPTIRKAGVVASQKRHLGRTIATGPLPFKVEMQSRSHCNSSLEILVVPIPRVTAKTSVTAELDFDLNVRTVIEYSNVYANAPNLYADMDMTFNVRSIIEYSEVNAVAEVEAHMPIIFDVKRKVVVVGVAVLEVGSFVSTRLEIGVNG